MAKERNYKFDNIKVLLIFLVVFGHMLEFCKEGSLIAEPLYLFIYSFHMGVFLFISGVFAKFSKKHVFAIFFAYILFQPFYRINPSRTYAFAFYNPSWILWYIFVFGLYTLIIPLIDTKSKCNRTIIFTISIILCLGSGLCPNFGYILSLQRFFAFLPFFVAGFYSKDLLPKFDAVLQHKKYRIPLAVILGIGSIATSLFVALEPHIFDKMLYGAFAYSELENYHAGYRLLFTLCGFMWTGFLYAAMPNKHVKFITDLGKYTLPIYLFHGLVVVVITFPNIFGSIEVVDILICLLFAIILPIIFGNNKFGPALKSFVSGDWFLKLCHKIKESSQRRKIKSKVIETK